MCRICIYHLVYTGQALRLRHNRDRYLNSSVSLICSANLPLHRGCVCCIFSPRTLKQLRCRSDVSSCGWTDIQSELPPPGPAPVPEQGEQSVPFLLFFRSNQSIFSSFFFLVLSPANTAQHRHATFNWLFKKKNACSSLVFIVIWP